MKLETSPPPVEITPPHPAYRELVAFAHDYLRARDRLEPEERQALLNVLKSVVFPVWTTDPPRWVESAERP